jgi:hypothetical protein
MRAKTTEIFITLIHEALHCWPNAFDEVSYLKDKHRHNFHIRMHKRVIHDDRDVEFIWWKHQVQKYLKTLPYDLGSTSCEMLAADLFDRFGCSQVEVSEDGELGAIVKEDTSRSAKLAWLAGIIDGEGSIGINRRKSTTEHGYAYAATVTIGNTDKNMIDNVASIYEEMGIRACPTISKFRLPSWKQMNNIYVSRREEILKLLETIHPYLVTKKERAFLAIEWCKRRLDNERLQPNHNQIQFSEIDDQVWDEMKSLNRRGSPEIGV